MALTARRNSISGVHRSSPVVCVRYTRSWAVDFWRKTVCGGERGFSRHDRTKERQQHFAAFEPACEAKRPVDHAIAGRDGTVLPSWPGYPSAGCSPAEPASVSPDSAILLLRTGQRLEQNSKPAKRASRVELVLFRLYGVLTLVYDQRKSIACVRLAMNYTTPVHC